MNNQPRILVVGAGPSGSFIAYNLAKHGVDVTVFEEHEKIGFPSHCAGHLSLKGLSELSLLPLPKRIIENTFRGAIFHSPKGREFSVRFPSAVTCAVNRELFDKHLSEIALHAGAHLFLSSRVQSLLIEDSTVRGVTIKQSMETRVAKADIVVDCGGVTSGLLRQAGLRSPDPRSIIGGVEAEVDNVSEIDSHLVEVFLGENYAPGFYAWLIPIGDNRAKIGLGAKRGNPKELLNRFMKKNPSASKKLSRARIMKSAYHPISIGGPVRKSCSNGFLVVGDAASQVKPTTGGGVVFGMTCAEVASRTIQSAVQSHDFSSKYLSGYQRRCNKRFGFDVNVMIRTRKLLNSLSDDKMDRVIGLCSKLNLDEAIQNVEEIDFQGKTLLSVLRDPRAWPTLLYFFFLYLSANP